MPRATTQVPEDDFLNDLSDIEERADIPMGSPTRHQSPAPTGENAGNTQDGNRDLGSTNSEAQAPRPNQGALQTGGNLRQTVDQLITSKKLSADAQRELHKYAKASGPERDVMAFASMVELKDDTSKIASAIVDNGIHPALVTNIRLYTAALFFSPDLPQYRTPRTGARSGALQKAVMKAMRASHVQHLPAASDKAETDKILSLIGTNLTNYRSSTKDQFEKRKPGEPEMDIGSLVARATKNTDVKITAPHYGRFAFLSRQFELWKNRENAETDTTNFWDWVDQALANVRKKTGVSQAKIDEYFKRVYNNDTAKWSQPVGELVEERELEEAQRHAHEQAREMVGK